MLIFLSSFREIPEQVILKGFVLVNKLWSFSFNSSFEISSLNGNANVMCGGIMEYN